MPQAIHIDGLGSRFEEDFGKNAGEVANCVIARDTSLQDLIRRFGGTVRVEQVPDEPRKLDPRAERFLADYEYEEPGSILAVYWRYHSLEAEEFDTVEEAELFLDGGEEYGSLAGEAIVDGDEIRVRD